MEHSHRVLDGSFCGYTLYGLYHDSFSLFCSGHACVIHDVVDVASCSSLCLILQRLHEFLFSLVGGKSGYALKFVSNLAVEVFDLVLARLDHSLAVVEVALESVKFLLAAVVFVLLLVELHLALLVAGFRRLRFLHPLPCVAFRLTEDFHLLFFSLKDSFLLYHLCLAVCVFKNRVGAGGGVLFADHGCRHITYYGSCRRNYDPYCCFHAYVVVLYGCL